MDSYSMSPVGYISSPFTGKFGLPRQSSLCTHSTATIIFYPPYDSPEAFKGLEGYSHIWLLWIFSENIREKPSLTVRPPKLGGNVRCGVFATRSPFRPNPIGLSCVRLLSVDTDKRGKIALKISGADLMDGTPILDVKPYLPFADMMSDAVGGFADAHVEDRVKVEIPDEIERNVPAELLPGLKEALSFDPRPAYHRDRDRIYGFGYSGYEIKFKVTDSVLNVIDIIKN